MKFSFNMDMYGAFNTKLDWQYEQHGEGDVLITVYPTEEADSGVASVLSFEEMFTELVSLNMLVGKDVFPKEADKMEMVDELYRIHESFMDAFNAAKDRVVDAKVSKIKKK